MSAGTNQLIYDGARVVRDAADVIDALLGPGVARPAAGPELDRALAEVLDEVEAGGGNPDSIALALQRGAEPTMAALARLELLGYLRRSFAGAYERTALPRP